MKGVRRIWKYDYLDGQRRHRTIAERVLGHPLPKGAEIHHVNEDEHDDRHCNLVICQDRSYHRFLHTRRRVLLAGGNPNLDRICSACKQVKPLSEFKQRFRQRHIGGNELVGNSCLLCHREREKRRTVAA